MAAGLEEKRILTASPSVDDMKEQTFKERWHYSAWRGAPALQGHISFRWSGSKKVKQRRAQDKDGPQETPQTAVWGGGRGRGRNRRAFRPVGRALRLVGEGNGGDGVKGRRSPQVAS